MRKRYLKSIENTEKIVFYMCKESDEKKRVFHQIFEQFKNYFWTFGSIQNFYISGNYLTKDTRPYIHALKQNFIEEYNYNKENSSVLDLSIIDSIFFVFDTISIVK